jgi:hypothetical protein
MLRKACEIFTNLNISSLAKSKPENRSIPSVHCKNKKLSGQLYDQNKAHQRREYICSWVPLNNAMSVIIFKTVYNTKMLPE